MDWLVCLVQDTRDLVCVCNCVYGPMSHISRRIFMRFAPHAMPSWFSSVATRRARRERVWWCSTITTLCQALSINMERLRGQMRLRWTTYVDRKWRTVRYAVSDIPMWARRLIASQGLQVWPEFTQHHMDAAVEEPLRDGQLYAETWYFFRLTSDLDYLELQNWFLRSLRK